MAHVSIELELAERFGHGRLWSGGVFTASRAVRVESSDLDDALAAIKAAVTDLTASPIKQPKPIVEAAPVPPPVAVTVRKPRGQRHTEPSGFFPADPLGGSTEPAPR